MQQIETNLIITNILNSMSPDLDDKQFSKLKGELYIYLHDVTIIQNTYEVAPTVQNNDTEKLKYFAASLRVSEKSENTIKQYIDGVMKLRNFIGKNLDDISTMDIKYYLASSQKTNNWKDTTLMNNINYIRAFYKFLVKEDIIVKNPMDKIESVKIKKKKKETFTPTDMEKLREVCRGDHRDIALIELLISSGIRVNELVQLKWKDIDFQELKFVVLGKGGKERAVKFTEKARYHLLEYYKERKERENRNDAEMSERPVIAHKKHSPKTGDYEGLECNGVRNVVGKLGKAANVSTKTHPHKFRRTFATEAINKGMTLETLRILMGHENYDTTLGYAEINNETVDMAYKKIMG